MQGLRFAFSTQYRFIFCKSNEFMLLLNISRSVTIIYSMKRLQYKYIFSANKQILMFDLFRLKIKIISLLHVDPLFNNLSISHFPIFQRTPPNTFICLAICFKTKSVDDIFLEWTPLNDYFEFMATQYR